MSSAVEKNAMVSVIIPTYNRAKLVGQAIESVLRQTFDDYEIIVIDDGSADDTRDVVTKKYPQVEYIYQDNAGVAAARNRGLRVAKGELVAFLDADDVWYDDKLEKQVQIMRGDKSVPLCFSDWRVIKNGVVAHDSGMLAGGLNLDTEFDYSNLITGFCILPSTVMVRRDLVLKYGLFNEQLALCEDWDLFTRISTEGKIVFINKPMIDRFLGQDNLIGRTEVWMRASVEIIAKHMGMIADGRLNVPNRATALERLGKRLLRDGERLAYILYTSGKANEARSVLLRCVFIGKSINNDIARLLIKTCIPHKLGRKIKHVVLGNRLNND
ncbi:glycosyltransferase [uncultured Pseudodesulfovibrio sp.]|uniref:glycosyltransferase family 2 protein n=1 Tax=uncultured Pseudodesulfovibrio sp. TaxID=2035858 RepID=UPI0029C7F899|nr:glycosyltransferase [uncultured Pseudodesulfovibrio sp.]